MPNSKHSDPKKEAKPEEELPYGRNNASYAAPQHLPQPLGYVPEAQQQQQQPHPAAYPPQPDTYPQYYNYGNQDSGYGAPPAAAPESAPTSSLPPAPVAHPAYYDYTAPTTYGEVLRSNGSNKWKTSLCCAPCASPCYFFGACCCPWCFVWMQRKKLLMGEWSRYLCCAGMCGDCRCCVCSGAEPCCMCLEAVCCLVCSVHGNRYMVMQHYNLDTDCCDMVIMCLTCCLQIIAAILNMDCLQTLADCIVCIVIGCMLTQNEVQMKKFGYPSGSSDHELKEVLLSSPQPTAAVPEPPQTRTMDQGYGRPPISPKTNPKKQPEDDILDML